jgi:hypothetical protein
MQNRTTRNRPGSDQFSYFVSIRRVGATVLVGAMGEIENVNHVFHSRRPVGRVEFAISFQIQISLHVADRTQVPDLRTNSDDP